MATKTIIDVSEHQGVINWDAVKGHIDGVIIRCGYGDDIASQDDKQWSANIKAVERLGIPYGVYLYSYADNMEHVKSEISHVLRLLKGHKPQYPVYIDLEEWAYGGIAVKAANEFCKQIKAAGYVPGVYTFESFFNEFMSGYNSYTLWVARYGVNDGKPHERPNIGVSYDAWQYTSNGMIGGYGGRLDVSQFFKTWGDGGNSSNSGTDSAKVSTSASTKAEKGGTVDDVLRIARAELSRNDGTKYGRWYENNVDKNKNNYDFAARGVPYCAMFVSWVFDQAGVKCAGLPGAYCPTMLQAAKNAKATVAAKNAKPGDVVFFDWESDAESDHVGIVESNNPTSAYLVTIEGNTDNGEVKRKTRYYGSICGVVRPEYGKAANSPAEVTTKPQAANKNVAFRLSTDRLGKKWLKQGAKTNGTRGIRWIAIKGVGKYRVCTQANGWLPWVDEYDVNDLENGCAGDGSPIIGVQVKSNKYRYSVRVRGAVWYPDMIGLKDTGGTSDNFAGDLANVIDGFKISAV